MSNFEELEKAKYLINDADKLINLKADFEKTSSQGKCDKYNLEFGGDDRFSVFSTRVYLDCHVGFYGNSSSSTFRTIDDNLAQKALNHVLNENMEMILKQMAEFMKSSARDLIDNARLELTQANDFIDKLESN